MSWNIGYCIVCGEKISGGDYYLLTEIGLYCKDCGNDTGDV